jgi:hypothetical protein
MLYKCYLRKGIVYVPTVGRRGGAYTDIEPVAAVPVTDAANLRRTFLDAIGRGNAPVPLIKGEWSPPVVLKHAGVKTWSAFAREARSWSIQEDDRGYRIVGYRKDKKGYWVEDPEQTTQFPPAAKVDDVIENMIAILQEAAQRVAGIER